VHLSCISLLYFLICTKHLPVSAPLHMLCAILSLSCLSLSCLEPPIPLSGPASSGKHSLISGVGLVPCFALYYTIYLFLSVLIIIIKQGLEWFLFNVYLSSVSVHHWQWGFSVLGPFVQASGQLRIEASSLLLPGCLVSSLGEMIVDSRQKFAYFLLTPMCHLHNFFFFGDRVPLCSSV
jgi:hypothetical protein